MTDFETAARKAAKAAFDVIRHIIAEHADLFEKTNETHWAARDVLEIEITKHYADLAETFGLLCELARKLKNRVDAKHTIHDAALSTSFRLFAEANFEWREIDKLLADPRIAALLKKG